MQFVHTRSTQLTHTSLIKTRDECLEQQALLDATLKELETFGDLPLELGKAEEAFRAKRAEHQALLARLQAELVAL